MRSQVRGDNDKRGFSAMSDREAEWRKDFPQPKGASAL